MRAIANATKKQMYIRRLVERNPAYGFLADAPVQLMCYAPNEDLCVSGGPMPYLLILVDGKAKIFITTENGKSLLLEFVEDFQIIGDLEFAAQKNSASASVRAITEVFCLGVPMTYLKTLTDPGFFKLISAEIAAKLESSTQSYAVNMLYPLETRLASYILYTQEEGIFRENLGAVSEHLGSSYRHVMRLLDAFIKRGILSRADRGYRVLDTLALRNLSQNAYTRETHEKR